MSTPRLTVVIPVYNEEAIVETALRGLVGKLDLLGYDYELIVSENGSRDRTAELVSGLAALVPKIRVLRTPEPNYGRALREGIVAARGEIVICDEIDLGDVDFYRRALDELAAGADFVVGSKRHPGSDDARPLSRRVGTAVITGLLRLAVGFRGTDTHGLKAFKRAAVLPVVQRCVVEHDLFASELVVRAQRAGLRVSEIPLRVREIRPPSVQLLHRVPRVLSNLARLTYVVRLGGSKVEPPEP